MITRLRVLSLACLAVFCFSGNSADSYARSLQEAQRFAITDLTFFWWKSFKPLDPEGTEGQPGTGALIMGDHTTNDYLELPEWQKDKAKIEPAALETDTIQVVYVRFKAEQPSDGPKLVSAEIRAKGSSGFPDTHKETIKFNAETGYSIGLVKPEKPAIDLVPFGFKDRFPTKVGVYSVTWAWTAENLKFTEGPDVPGPIDLGSVTMEIYLALEKPYKAEKTLAEQFGMRFFFKRLVKFSCEKFPDPVQLLYSYEESIYKHYIEILHELSEGSSKLKYTFPTFSKIGYTPPEHLLHDEMMTAFLLSTQRASCGFWVNLFLQVILVQNDPKKKLVKVGPMVDPGVFEEPQPEPIPFAQVDLENPEGGTETFEIPLFIGDPHWADTMRTANRKAINAETKEWTFNDHCYLERQGVQRSFWDPSFERFKIYDKKEDWWTYLQDLMKDSQHLSVIKSGTTDHPSAFILGRGFWFPNSVEWYSRANAGPKEYRIHEWFSGDDKNGRLVNP